jgi:hypothetical protein
MEWVSLGPVQLELNRDVFMGEEIICSYEWASLNDLMKDVQTFRKSADSEVLQEILPEEVLQEIDSVAEENSS